MSGITLRVVGAVAITVGLICLLSGWSAALATEGIAFTALETLVVICGLFMVYRGENTTTSQTPVRRFRRN